MIKAVLFDLDGTLLDSAPDLVASLNFLRAAEGLQALPLAALRRSVSHGAAGLIRDGMPPCDAETFAMRRDALVDHYANNSFVHSRPFEGVDELLEGLAGMNIPWGIVTNKLEYLCTPILDQTGWRAAVTALICGDTVRHAKPHPEPVLAACHIIGVGPQQTLMVGDDPRDIEAGQRAGSHTAMAMYGYAADQNEDVMPRVTALIETPCEVLDLVSQMRDT